jgi:hypothetical protein
VTASQLTDALDALALPALLPLARARQRLWVQQPRLVDLLQLALDAWLAEHVDETIDLDGALEAAVARAFNRVTREAYGLWVDHDGHADWAAYDAAVLNATR